jgi:hypothetical protein
MPALKSFASCDPPDPGQRGQSGHSTLAAMRLTGRVTAAEIVTDAR